MRCSRCDAELPVTGLFPGAPIRCPCGMLNTLALPSRAAAAYRSPAEPAQAAEPPVRRRPDEEEAPCPRCKSFLGESTHQGEPVHACASCGGVFVDHASLSRLVQAARAQGGGASTSQGSKLEAAVSYVGCPVCGETMNRMSFGRRSGTVVDVCKPHGTWFDAGELSRVLELAASGVLDAKPPPPPPVERQELKMAQRAAALLEVRRLQDERNIQEATGVIEDLLYLLSGNFLWAWRRRRHR